MNHSYWICVQLALNPQGCTTRDILAATGWRKSGGFYHAVRNAGYDILKHDEGDGRRPKYRYWAVPKGQGGII